MQTTYWWRLVRHEAHPKYFIAPGNKSILEIIIFPQKRSENLINGHFVLPLIYASTFRYYIFYYYWIENSDVLIDFMCTTLLSRNMSPSSRFPPLNLLSNPFWVSPNQMSLRWCFKSRPYVVVVCTYLWNHHPAAPRFVYCDEGKDLTLRIYPQSVS